MKPARVDLEDLVQRIGWKGRHADYLLITHNAVIIVEETGRAKLDDIEKLENTVEALKEYPFKDSILPPNKPSKIIAIVHAKCGVDPMIYRSMISKTKNNIIYRSANCQQHLKTILHEHGVSQHV